MPDYKQTSGEANAWRRSFRVIIDNPLNANSTVRFFEEDVIVLGEKVIRSESGSTSATFDPNHTVMLRNPATGELTGGYSTQQNLYEILYSLYMQTALERDNSPA